VERWALTELESLVSNSAKAGDVAVYTSKFIELDLLLPKDCNALSRILAYEKGLPEEYRCKCAEQRHTTLQSATEAMLAFWNAESSSRAQSRGAGSAAPLGQMSDINRGGGDRETDQHSTPSLASVDPRSAANHWCAMITERMPYRGGGGFRGRGGSERGRGNGRHRERESSGEQRRSARSRTPGISDEVARARINAGQCIRCGEEGHFRFECTNGVKPTK
jgi:hypothetical protein